MNERPASLLLFLSARTNNFPFFIKNSEQTWLWAAWQSTTPVKVSLTLQSHSWTWALVFCSRCPQPHHHVSSRSWNHLPSTSGCTYLLPTFLSQLRYTLWHTFPQMNGTIHIRAKRRTILWRTNSACLTVSGLQLVSICTQACCMYIGWLRGGPFLLNF